jgi:hypothetical protein
MDSGCNRANLPNDQKRLAKVTKAPSELKKWDSSPKGVTAPPFSG